MHELAICSAIVETVVRHAKGRPVSAVNVKVGALRQVVPASLQFYFEVVSRETLCDGAELSLELLDGLLRCSDCGYEWDPAPEPLHEGDPAALLPRFRCPACSAAGAEVVRGEELLVESIDVTEGPPERARSAGRANGVNPRQSQAS